MTEKQELILKITKYLGSVRFATYLKKDLKISYTNIQLQKKKVTELRDILKHIQVNLDNKNLDKFYHSLAIGGASVVEKTISPLYDIDGFADNLVSNENFWDVYERYKIENTFPNIPPAIQLCYIVTSTIITTHEVNKIKKMMPANASKSPMVEMKGPDEFKIGSLL